MRLFDFSIKNTVHWITSTECDSGMTSVRWNYEPRTRRTGRRMPRGTFEFRRTGERGGDIAFIGHLSSTNIVTGTSNWITWLGRRTFTLTGFGLATITSSHVIDFGPVGPRGPSGPAGLSFMGPAGFGAGNGARGFVCCTAIGLRLFGTARCQPSSWFGG